MKLIPLSKGKFAMVDDADFEPLSAYSWFLESQAGYAARSLAGIRSKNQRMHIDLLGPPPLGLECDHKNGNRLDYQRDNLRYVTHGQNCCNKGKSNTNTSGFKGVFACGRRWRAAIKVMRKFIYLGAFATKEDAARAYDAASRIYHGPYGRLNFPDPEPVPGFPLSV